MVFLLCIESVKAHALRDLIPALLSEYNATSAPSACQCDWNDFTERKEQNDTDIQVAYYKSLITEPAFPLQV